MAIYLDPFFLPPYEYLRIYTLVVATILANRNDHAVHRIVHVINDAAYAFGKAPVAWRSWPPAAVPLP